MNVGWSNQTWFMADSVLTANELTTGMKDFEPAIALALNNENVSIDDALNTLANIAAFYKIGNVELVDFEKKWNDLQLTNFDSSRSITKKEFAVMLDAIVNPFGLKDVDFNGQFK